jgi:adenylate kinase
MKIILLGPPGSGKGTQGNLIENKFGFPKISAGDILRKAVEEGTSLGMKAKESMDKGELVKDRLIIDLIKQRIHKQDCRNGYTLDGFPRNISQARSLEKMDAVQNEIVIDIRISDRIAIKRLSSRWICTECHSIYNIDREDLLKNKRCERCGGKLIQRGDDKPEVIEKRLAIYHNETEKLIQYYKNKGIYRAVDGQSSRALVFKRICSIINKSYNKEKELEALT